MPNICAKTILDNADTIKSFSRSGAGDARHGREKRGARRRYRACQALMTTFQCRMRTDGAATGSDDDYLFEARITPCRFSTDIGRYSLHYHAVAQVFKMPIRRLDASTLFYSQRARFATT